jgi:hypothetical protein
MVVGVCHISASTSSRFFGLPCSRSFWLLPFADDVLGVPQFAVATRRDSVIAVPPLFALGFVCPDSPSPFVIVGQDEDPLSAMGRANV